MALEPPPRPPTIDEWTRRYRAGARTFEELDPDFCAWYRRQLIALEGMRRRLILNLWALIAAAVCLLLIDLFRHG